VRRDARAGAGLAQAGVLLARAPCAGAPHVQACLASVGDLAWADLAQRPPGASSEEACAGWQRPDMTDAPD